MKKSLYLFISILPWLTACGQPYRDSNMNIIDLEQMVRKEQDKRAVFSYEEYEMLLRELDDPKYVVLPLYQFKDYYDSTKIIVGLRHDVDCHPFKGLEMGKMENKHNFKATYYYLPTAKYYGFVQNNKFKRYSCLTQLYEQMNQMGHEIGIHNDYMTVMIEWKIEPFAFNAVELLYYSTIGIKIHGTAAHGSTIARATVTNYEIFKDFATKDSVSYAGKKYPIGIDSLKNWGFEYEAYFIDYQKYLSDAGGKWVYYIKNTKQQSDIDINGVVQTLKDAVPGDRIVILTHPVWWGK